MSMQNLERRVNELGRALGAFSEDLQLAYRYIRSDAASSLTKSRLILEKLVVRLYTTEMGREPRKPLLGDMLVDNQFTRKIDRRVLSRMNGVRDMGNLGPHGEAVEPSDAARVLDDLCEVLEWYLQRKGTKTHFGAKARGGAAISKPARQEWYARRPWLIASSAALLLAIAAVAAIIARLPFGGNNPWADTGRLDHSQPTSKESSPETRKAGTKPAIQLAKLPGSDHWEGVITK